MYNLYSQDDFNDVIRFYFNIVRYFNLATKYVIKPTIIMVECNATQRNAMQRNAMQCNVM